MLAAGTRVLVTGGAGFIGRALIAFLTSIDGIDIVATTSRTGVTIAGAHVVHADLTDLDAVHELIDRTRPDVVFNLAGAVTGARGHRTVRPTLEHNLVGTVALLEAIAEHTPHTRVVHAGSLEEPVGHAPASSPYAASKAAAHEYVRMFHHLYGIPVTTARIFMVYGPGEQFEARLVPYVIRTLLQGTRPELSSGARLVDWVHVDDIVDGLVRLATAPVERVGGRAIDLGTGRLTSVHEVAHRIAALIDPRADLGLGRLADRPDEQERVADVAATRAALDWAPAITLEDGLAATVDWFRAHPAAH